MQANCVDSIKRAVLRQLHAGVAGERPLLRIYSIGEESSEIAIQSDLLGQRPAWLTRQMEQHLTDERSRASLFDTGHALRPLLVYVLGDEDRRVRLFQHTLARRALPSEYGRMVSLLDEMRIIGRAWRLSSALIMYLAGAALRLWPARR